MRRAFLLGLVVLVSCGETSRKPASAQEPEGGSAGSGASDGRGGAAAGSSASGGVAVSGGVGGETESFAGQGTAGDATGEGGEAGASDAHYSLVTVTPEVPEAFRARAVPPQVLLMGSAPAVVSRDGSRIYGIVDGMIVNPDDSAEIEQFAYTWSRAGGTVLLDSDNSTACLSADGSTLYGLRPLANDPTRFVPYRWTEANGQESLGFDFAAGVGLAFNLSCSRDGNVVAMMVQTDAPADLLVAVFVSGKNQNEFKQLALPNATDHVSDFLLSADGSTLLVTALDAQGKQTTSYRALEADGFATLQPLMKPSGALRCFPSLLTNDASFVGGACEQGALRSFLVTAPSPQMVLLPAAFGEISFMTDDGVLVLGSTLGNATALVDGKPIELQSADTREWSALDDTGKSAVAYADRRPVVGFSQAQSFTLAGGFVTLPLPSGVYTSSVQGVSIEGGIAFGISPIDVDAQHDVLWDAQGVRDLRDELQSAGLDVQKFNRLMPIQVNVDHDTVRIIGMTTDSASPGARQTFIAEMPRR